MQLTGTILAGSYPQGKLLTALLTLCTLRWAALLAGIGAFLVVALFIFTVILDALTQLCMHVSQVWNASTPIERLLILLIAWAFFYKMTPYLVKLCKLGKVF
jgi:hypothetical protein